MLKFWLEDLGMPNRLIAQFNGPEFCGSAMSERNDSVSCSHCALLFPWRVAIATPREPAEISDHECWPADFRLPQELPA